MHQITTSRSFGIKPGHFDDVVRGLRGDSELILDVPYAHARTPPPNTRLWNERELHPHGSGLEGFVHVEGHTVQHEHAARAYVPVVRVDPDALVFLNTDHEGFRQLHGKILKDNALYLVEQ